MLTDKEFILKIKAEPIFYAKLNGKTQQQRQLLKEQKEKAWEKLAQECNLKSTADAENKWKFILAQYLKYILQGRRFEFTEQMLFMQPYILSGSSDSSDSSDLDLDEADLQRILDSDSEEFVKDATIVATTKKAKTDSPLQTLSTAAVTTPQNSNASQPKMVAPVSSFIDLNPATESLTPLELIFIGYARVLQKMPPVLQIQTKRKIADIMDEAELTMWQEKQ